MLPPTMSAKDASAALGVSLATLYAYVSRGMVRSEPAPGGRRARRYLRADIDRLTTRKAARRDPARVAEGVLAWGMPVIDSAITAIVDGRPWYRGFDAIELARQTRFEEVAALLWQVDAEALVLPPTALSAARDAVGVDPLLGPIERCQVALPLVGLNDPCAWDHRPAALVRGGAQILQTVAAALAGPERSDSSTGAAATLSAGWGLGPDRRPAVESALILCADHELNISAFTARCVASAGASVYDAVTAALAALKGHRHGGMSARVTALVVEAETLGPRAAVEGRLRRGEDVPGFGHPLYPAGDPRGLALLELARSHATDSGRTRALRVLDELMHVADEILGDRPTIDVGLVALTRVLSLPQDAPLVMFAAGRTAGWIAHVVEEHARGVLIRPRARYVGVAPRR